MEQTAVISSDESSSEGNMHAEVVNVPESLSSVPDIVNGCDGSLNFELMEQDTAFHCSKSEKSLEPEDLINNNKDEFEQDCSDIPKDIDTPEEDFSTEITKLTFLSHECDSIVVDQEARCSAFSANNFSGKIKKHLEMEPRQVSSKNIKADMGANNKRKIPKIEQDSRNLCDKTKALDPKVHELFKVDLLKQNSSAGKKSNRPEPSLKKHQKDKIMSDEIFPESVDGDCYMKNHLSTHFNEESALSTEATERHHRAPIKAQDFLEDLANDVEAPMEEAGTYVSPGTCIQSGKRKLESNPKCLDLLVNGARCQREPTLKNVQPFLKNQCEDDFEKDKVRNGYQPSFGKRLALTDDNSLLSDEFGFVAEDNVYEKEERRDREYFDHFLPYSSSEDRADPRKERHRYVSDKLDPDVLQLLEMHLRKQQLVDIKEEGEEELLDMHINKEKSHTETFRGFRNAAPVLDIVLEEPELEHTSDILEEDEEEDDDRRTPSDIESDDGSNICAMEQGLMESLQNELISKTSKIDKDEIATILRGASPDIALGEHSNKLKDHTQNFNDCKSTYNIDVEAKEKCTQVQEAKKLRDLQTSREFVSDKEVFVSDCKTEGNVEIHLRKSFVDTFAKSELSTPLNDEQLGEKNHVKVKTDGVGVCSQSSKQLNNKKVGLDSDVSKTRNHNFEINGCTISSAVDIAFEPQAGEPFIEQKPDQSDPSKTGTQDTESTTGTEVSCPFSYNDTKSKNMERKSPPLDSDLCVSENPSLVVRDGAEEESLEREETSLTDQDTNIKVNVGSCSETSSLESPAETDTLQINLEDKILSLLEKARAADFRSSHLQAEAENLLKESKKLQSECKSLSEEAAELFSIFSQQGIVRRHRIEQAALKSTHGEEEPGTSETKLRKLETLICRRKANTQYINPRTTAKGEDDLKLLSRKYGFLKEEGPEIIRELHSLQKDLKNLPQLQNKETSKQSVYEIPVSTDTLLLECHDASKPVHALYNMLWGGLIAGGTMLLVWWSTKQLG